MCGGFWRDLTAAAAVGRSKSDGQLLGRADGPDGSLYMVIIPCACDRRSDDMEEGEGKTDVSSITSSVEYSMMKLEAAGLSVSRHGAQLLGLFRERIRVDGWKSRWRTVSWR